VRARGPVADREPALKRTLLLLISILLVSCALPAGAAAPPAEQRIEKARALFKSYVDLGRAYAPKLANLYADSALIRNTRRYPTGQVREVTIPAPQYKTLLRETMDLAKLRGDVSTYSDVTYASEGDGVRIRATRFSELKKYSSPISILVRPDSTGSWRIFEEISESRP